MVLVVEEEAVPALPALPELPELPALPSVEEMAGTIEDALAAIRRAPAGAEILRSRDDEIIRSRDDEIDWRTGNLRVLIHGNTCKRVQNQMRMSRMYACMLSQHIRNDLYRTSSRPIY